MGWWSRLFGRRAPQAPAPVPDGPAVEASHAPIDQLAAREFHPDSPEFHEFIARAELEAGTNLAHGVQHLANLLLIDPQHPQWRELLDRYVAAAGNDLDTLVPDVDPRYAATEAVRAWIWHVQGRQADAVSRLVDVASTSSHSDLLDAWALHWLEPEGAIESLPESVGLHLFGTLLVQNGEAQSASATQLDSMRRWSALLERAEASWADTSLLLMMRVGLMRKAGNFNEALALAGPLDQARDFNRVAAIGLALRAKRHFVESAQAFEHGAGMEAANVAAWLEAGDSWLAAERWPEALAAYQAALAIEPGQAWAEPSAWYCHWKMEGDDPWRSRIGAAATGGNQRAHALLFRELGAIAESSDASAKILRHMCEKWLATPPGQKLDGFKSMAVSTVEAPSARLAIELELAAFKLDPHFEMTYGAVTNDDPRVAVADVEYMPWVYDGVRATPGLPAPTAEVTALVADLASQRYHPYDNWAQASHVAARLGPAATGELLSVMVNPPPLPAGARALAWLPRVQLAAAMVVGQIDTGWQGSRRRAALLSLLLGPSDWTTVAGIRVLAWIARTEPAHAQDIHRLFEQRERHLPDGHWDWIETLFQEWQTLPSPFDDERTTLKSRLEELE